MGLIDFKGAIAVAPFLLFQGMPQNARKKVTLTLKACALDV
jgi:hypothetical protein